MKVYPWMFSKLVCFIPRWTWQTFVKKNWIDPKFIQIRWLQSFNNVYVTNNDTTEVEYYVSLGNTPELISYPNHKDESCSIRTHLANPSESSKQPASLMMRRDEDDDNNNATVESDSWTGEKWAGVIKALDYPTESGGEKYG